MEIWFWAAVISAIFSGFGNFLLKSAAHRGYSSEVFILIGGFTSVILSLPLALFIDGVGIIVWFAALIACVGGFFAGIGGIAKVYALRYIDTTIFFPLFKLVSPALAIAFGVFFFQEQFNVYEWVGLILGLTVPLLLINKSEHHRQNNLVAGLLLVLLAGTISAGAAASNKYAIDLFPSALWILVFASVGVFAGSVAMIIKRGGWRRLVSTVQEVSTRSVLWWASVRALFMTISFGAVLYAFTHNGTLAVVHTIQSLYILIPIVLAIILYKEHWNVKKVGAVIISVLALALLG